MKQVIVYNINCNSNKDFITFSKNNNIRNVNVLSKYNNFNNNGINLKNYIKNNILNSFILFTLLNECCRYILLYHNLLNCYHGNTSTDKFIFNIKDNCISMPRKFIGNDSNALTHRTKIKDFSIFFNSFYDDLSYNNKHFVKHFLYYNETFIKSLS